MKTVLLVGGTGNLGGLIGRELVKRGARLRLLVRPGSRSKVPADLAQAAEIVEDEQTAFKDVFTVVSAVQGHPGTIVDAQLRFLRAACEAGVRRFIACSDYSIESVHRAGRRQRLVRSPAREFSSRADEERGDVEVVHVLNGAFLWTVAVLFGFLGAVNLQKRKASRLGPMAMRRCSSPPTTTRPLIRRPRRLTTGPCPTNCSVAGDSLSFDRLVKEVEAGLGAPMTVKSLGSFSDLDATIKTRYATEPANVPGVAPADVLARDAERHRKAGAVDE